MSGNASVIATFQIKKRQSLQCFEVWNVLGATEVVRYSVSAFSPRHGGWIFVNWAQPWLLLQSSLQLTCRFISSRSFWWWGRKAKSPFKN